ncbi:MAG: type VI secretion system-associated protein TagF, partial [Pseudomonadales bacterium]
MAGFFGKLPSRGDFVSRDLPRSFVDAMDRWFRDGLHTSKKMLGDKWFPHYQVMPVWHFFMGEAVLDNQAWLGTWIPSEDRVNRHYPLLMACPVDRVETIHDLRGYDDWLAEVTDLLIDALLESRDFEVLYDSFVALEPGEAPARNGCTGVPLFDMDDGWLGRNLFSDEPSQAKEFDRARIEPDCCVWQT